MLRPALACVALAAAVIGGLLYGAIQAFCDDTGPDW